MRLLYASLSYVPSRRASSVQVVKMCSAFAQLGHQVTLLTKLCPARMETRVTDDFGFYGVSRSFSIKKLSRPGWPGGGLIHAAAVWREISRARTNFDLVFARDLIAAAAAAMLRVPFVLEAHGVPESSLNLYLWRVALRSPELQHLVVISRALGDELSIRRLVPERVRVVVAHDAAEVTSSPSAPRLNQGPFRIGYVGNLYEGRGVELLIELASRLPDLEFHIVGGNQADIERWEARAKRPNLYFRGFVPPGELGDCYREFDALAMPFPASGVSTASGGDSSRWMSPMKMFEYMAAGRPILASDLPVLREVLRDGENAVLLPPEDAEAWARGIRDLQASPERCRDLGECARKDIENCHNWVSRARSVLPSGGGVSSPTSSES